MNIICACDEKFLQYNAVMLCSLFENNPAPIQIHFLHGGIPEKKIRKLKGFVERYHNVFRPYMVDESRLQNLKVDLHASIANYYRLLMPVILPDSINKVLYLDSDLIVRKSIDELWNTDIDDYYLAAVENLGFKEQDRLFLPQGSKIFNSGVLLINLLKWRQERIGFKVIDFIREYPERIKFWDQDGLNAVTVGHWKELPVKWNTYHAYFFPNGNENRNKDITSDPGIVHFSGEGLKPWQPATKHMYKEEYLKYESLTPFAPKRNSIIQSIQLISERTIKSSGKLSRKTISFGKKAIKKLLRFQNEK